MNNAKKGMLVALVALSVSACGGEGQLGAGDAAGGADAADGAMPGNVSGMASNRAAEQSAGGDVAEGSIASGSAVEDHDAHHNAIRDAVGEEYAEKILEFGGGREIYTLETHDGRTVTWYESGYGSLSVVEEATGAMRITELNPKARPSEVFAFYEPGASIPAELASFDQRMAEVAPVYAEIERVRAALFPETLVSAAQPEGHALELEQPVAELEESQFATVGSAMTVAEFEDLCEHMLFSDLADPEIQTDRGGTAKIKKENVDRVHSRATSHDGTIQWQYKKRIWWGSYEEIWKRNVKKNKVHAMLDGEPFVDFDAEIAIYPGSGERASQCMIYLDD